MKFIGRPISIVYSIKIRVHVTLHIYKTNKTVLCHSVRCAFNLKT